MSNFVSLMLLLRYLLFLAVIPVVSNCQTLRFDQPKPNCNPSSLVESRFDNPFSLHHGYYQPSIIWAAEYGVASGVVAYGITKTTHIRPLYSSVISSIGIGLIPHIAGYGRGEYNISLDWLYDLWTRSLPVAVVLGDVDTHQKLSAVSSGLIFIGGTLILHCYASP